MKERILKYRVKAPANRLNTIIKTEIKRKMINKRYSISGKYSDEGGFDITSTFLCFESEFNTDSFVKLNLKSVNSNTEGTESLLILKSIQGYPYYMHFWFSIGIIIIPFLIVFYQLIFNGINESLALLIFPFFGFLYAFLIYFFAEDTTSVLANRIEWIMRIEHIEYFKLENNK